MVEHLLHKVQANIIDSVLNSYVHVDENNGLFIYLLALENVMCLRWGVPIMVAV